MRNRRCIAINRLKKKQYDYHDRVRHSLIILLILMLCVIVVNSFGKEDTPKKSMLKYPDKQIGLVFQNEMPQSSNSLPVFAESEDNTELGYNGKCVVIDPGHGGVDPGCSICGVNESDINLTISIMIKKKLEDLGYEVILTRDEDITISIEDRLEIASIHSADILVSIHQNSHVDDPSIYGIETWYNYKTNELSERLAKYIQDETIQETHAKDRGLKPDRALIITRKAKMPSCLIETGFLTNAGEIEMLQDGLYQEKVADGIVAGIEMFFAKTL